MNPRESERQGDKKKVRGVVLRRSSREMSSVADDGIFFSQLVSLFFHFAPRIA